MEKITPTKFQSVVDKLPSSEAILEQVEIFKAPAMAICASVSVGSVLLSPVIYRDYDFPIQYKQIEYSPNEDKAKISAMHRKALQMDQKLDLSDARKDMVTNDLPQYPSVLARHLLGCSNACNNLIDSDEKQTCWYECEEDTVDYNAGDELLTVAPSSFSTWTRMSRNGEFGIRITFNGILNLSNVDWNEWKSSGQSVPLPRVVTNGYIVLPNNVSWADFRETLELSADPSSKSTLWFENAMIDTSEGVFYIKNGQLQSYPNCDLLPERDRPTCLDAFSDVKPLTSL